MAIMKIQMLTVGRYSWDGKNIRTYHKDSKYDVIPDSEDDSDVTGVHKLVSEQWLKRKMCKKVK